MCWVLSRLVYGLTKQWSVGIVRHSTSFERSDPSSCTTVIYKIRCMYTLLDLPFGHFAIWLYWLPLEAFINLSAWHHPFQASDLSHIVAFANAYLCVFIFTVMTNIIRVCSALIEDCYLAMWMTGSCPFLIGNLLQSSVWQLPKASMNQLKIHWPWLEIILSEIISDSIHIAACSFRVSDLISSYAHG